jgi:hypothetical protein
MSGAPPSAPLRPHRCSACGTIGRLSLADPQPDDNRPVLRLSPKGTPRLLCTLCRDDAS